MGSFDNEIVSHHIAYFNQEDMSVVSLNEEMIAKVYNTKEMGDYIKISKKSKHPLYEPINLRNSLEEQSIEPTKEQNQNESKEEMFYDTEINIFRKGVTSVSIVNNGERVYIPIFLISRPIVLNSEERGKKIEEEENIFKEFQSNDSLVENSTPVKNDSSINLSANNSSIEEPTELDDELDNDDDNVVVTIGNVSSSPIVYNVDFDSVFYSEENTRIRQQIDRYYFYFVFILLFIFFCLFLFF